MVHIPVQHPCRAPLIAASELLPAILIESSMFLFLFYMLETNHIQIVSTDFTRHQQYDSPQDL